MKSGFLSVNPFGSGQPAGHQCVRFEVLSKARSRLRDLAVVGTGRRGCLSFDVRHLQQTDLRLERSVASDSVLVFIVVLKLLDLSWAATE